VRAKRRQRLIVIVFLFVGASVSITLVLRALSENLNMFYPPEQVVSGAAPVGTQIRAGGMVLDGSVQRRADGLDVSFVLTDYQGAEFTVYYSGILPDLFREGQGILVQGELGSDRVFQAKQVLAKHDENYMPPELAGMATANAKKPSLLNDDR
jgi:cytochrome c-type biogenesis protein CcmE